MKQSEIILAPDMRPFPGQSPPAMTEKIAILDCGAQYTQVIDRKIRALRVETEIYPITVTPEHLAGCSGIILSGGPHSVYEPDAPRCHPGIFDLNLPVLGICYGMQLLNQHFGGTVAPVGTREYGETTIDTHIDNHPHTLLFEGLSAHQTVLMSHGDSVTQLAEGFEAVATSNNSGHKVIAAMANPSRKLYGVQFHPEVELTECGNKMLANFLYQVCNLTGTYTMDCRLERAVAEIQQKVGQQPVFVLVSGGVDSSVTAAVLLKALGPEQVFAVHIDSGMMRESESDLVCDALKAIGLKHLRRINAAETFLSATTEIDGEVVGPLSTLSEPESKRRVIGDVFYRLIQQAMAEADCEMDAAFIAQGTLRPDLIESGNREVSQTAHKIKTHHNDVPLIQEHRKRGLIIEPNRDWHKDEVREIGRMLGLPEALVNRQPFPGPGLGVRMLCADAPYPVEAGLQEALDTLLRDITLLPTLAGVFSGRVLPIRSVGVQGDGRSYRHVAAIWPSQPVSLDKLPDWQTLYQLARLIPNKLSGINRVALLVGGVPPRNVDITPTFLTPETLSLHRKLDQTVTRTLEKAGALAKIDQLATVLLPIGEAGNAQRSVAIRAVITSDYMTARPASVGNEPTDVLCYQLLQGLGQTLLEQNTSVCWVLYDITGKPPATVEWE